MINISERLKTVADLVLKEKTNKVIDVGCDHAFLDIYLLQNNCNIKLVATDNKKAPLENARKNIEKYSFLNKIELYLKDGIEKIDNDIDTVVIAGMGMETIVDILNRGKKELKHINRLVLSSNNKYEELRKKVISLGFKINEEVIVYEDNKYYIVIEFVKGYEEYAEEELFFGPKLLCRKDKLFYDYYNNIKNEDEFIISNIPFDNNKRKYLLNELELLNRILK